MDWTEDKGRLWARHIDWMETMLAPIDAPLIGALDLAGARCLADIGCGGGGFSRALAEAGGPDARTEAYDISSDLIALARVRAARAGLSFHRLDAGEEIPAEAPFDRLASRFGVMFFADPARAFAKLRDWLTPGGRFAFAVWGPMSGNPWMNRVRAAVAGAVHLPPPDPDAPGPFRYAEVQRFIALLEQAGFAQASALDWQGALRIGGGLAPDEAAAFALSAFSVAEPLRAAPADVGKQVQVRLADQFSESLDEAGHTVQPAQVWIVSGSV